MDAEGYIWAKKTNNFFRENNKKFYKNLNKDQTRIANNIIESFKKQVLLFTSTTKLTKNEASIPQFSIFPKGNKPKLPGRPVSNKLS